MGTRSKNFAGGSLEVIVGGATQFLLLNSWTVSPGCGRNSTVYLLNTDLEHIHPPGEPWPGPSRYHHLISAATESLKKNNPPVSRWQGT